LWAPSNRRSCDDRLGASLATPAAVCTSWQAGARATPCQCDAILLIWERSSGLPESRRTEARMVPFFVQIKCQLGQSYEVANKLADAELASEIYSTAGHYDLLVKFYVDDKTDIGHFVNEKVQTLPGIQDTHTIITFKAF
jgi:DNA-binding Lrp family transcriptional regulator